MSQTCRCPAYSFPHRWGGGKCSGALSICMECGEECHEVKRDFGYGSYSYGSINSVHHDYRMVSDCCEAEVYKVYEDNAPIFTVKRDAASQGR